MAESPQKHDNQALTTNLRQLFEIQTLDTKIINHSAELETLEKQLNECERNYRKQKAMIADLDQQLELNKANQRKVDVTMSDKELFLKKLERQSTQVKTGEAYAALMHELEHAKKQISEFETQLIESMEEHDFLSKERQSNDAKIQELDTRLHIRKKEFDDKKTIMDKVVTDLEQQRNKLIKHIDPQLVRKYEGIKKKHNPALVLVVKSQCSGCHMLISVDLEMAKSVITCDNCGRILVGEWMLNKEQVD